MIGMPIMLVRICDCPGLMTTNHVGRRSHERGRLFDSAVGPAQVLAPRRAQYVCRRGRLTRAYLRRAVRAKLAGRQVAQPDGAAFGRVTCDRRAETDLEVVGMGAEDKKVDLSHGLIHNVNK